MKWKPIDVISIILVAGCLIMVMFGIDTYVKWTLLAVVGAYYGVDLTPFIKLGRVVKKPKEDKPNEQGL
tara:strand:- start:7571 stop:7777 length:207 start_codon:yes stop_codon:yes gene_type:complete